jgi:surface polysaccharide O-acyltransferase-like enzyme
VGLQFGYFGLYMVFYALGIIASRNNWLNQLSVKRARKWGIAAVAAIPLIVLAWISLLANPSLFGEFVGGFHWRSFALSAWEAVVCTGLCYFFLSWFKNKLNTSTSFWGQMAANSYSVYFIHPVIVVGFTILLEQFSLIPEIKFLLACGLSVVVCFVVSHLLRKIPGVKRVL